MEKLQRRLKSIAKDVTKAAYQPTDTEQPYRGDSEPRTSVKETGTPDFLQRRHSCGDSGQVSYSNLNPASYFKELTLTTSVDRRPRDKAITRRPTPSFIATVFRRQSRNHAGVVSADRNPINGAEITSAELAQNACPSTGSLASMPVEESNPLPSRGPVQTDPPWVALYLAREQAEDQLWEEKPTRSVWGTLRAVVGFGDAGSSNKSKQPGDSVMRKSQTA
jgi:hypothetical protein